MPRAVQKSKKSRKKAYQREKNEKKYAPGHPSEHELQNRNKKQNNKNKPETKARIKQETKARIKQETKARIKLETRTGNIYSRFVEKTYYMCYSKVGSFCLIFRKTERRKQYERMMKYGRIQKENL